MWRTYHFLIPLLSIFLVRVDLTDLIPLSMTAQSIKVLDGDTILVNFYRSSYRVRLRHIDAPEKGQMAGKLDLGEYSSQCLRKLIKPSMKLYIHGHDRYHRILGDLENVTLKMVQNGCAYIYDYAKFSNRWQKTSYLQGQNQAQSSRLGLWKFKVLNPREHRKNYPFRLTKK